MSPKATQTPTRTGRQVVEGRASGEPPTSRPVERPKVYPDSWEGLVDDEGYACEICEPAPLWREW